MTSFFSKSLLPYLFAYGLVFTAHWWMLNSFETSEKQQFLIQSYLINIGIVSFYMVLCYKVFIGLKVPAGAYIMLSLFTKLFVYVAFFHPFFKADGILERQEFFIFFIPYCCSLIFGIALFSRLTHNSPRKSGE